MSDNTRSNFRQSLHDVDSHFYFSTLRILNIPFGLDVSEIMIYGKLSFKIILEKKKTRTKILKVVSKN